MQILDIIKNHKSIRVYSRKPVPRKIINKILTAGIWGPSIHHIQPWKFIVIKDARIRKKILKSIIIMNKKVDLPKFIFYPTIQAVAAAKTIICVYNTKELSNFFVKPNKYLFKNLELVEISSIAAAIQNMILTAESFGVGSCWLDTPLFCKKDINRILDVKDELIAVLTLGYPAENGKRTPRKPILETLRYI